MTALLALVCGSGYVIDWNAVSAIATTLAVVVALWISARDRKVRRLEKLEAEARAAEVVQQNLSAINELFPDVLALIEKSNGVLFDNPGSDVIYGVDACRGLIERETFCHQLPSNLIASGELVASLARKWCADIEVRKQAQRDERFQRKVCKTPG
jgi:hypothetical protein